MKFMGQRFWLACCVLLSVTGTSLFVGTEGASAQEEGATLNYPDAEIRSFINIVAQQTGRSFVVGPQVNGKVTIISPPEARLSKAEVWEVFLATMQVKGYSVLPITDGEYKIIPSELSTRQPGSSLGKASAGEVVTRIVQLNYVDARTAANSLKSLIGERGIVTPVVESNSLIMVDTAANISRILAVIDNIDTDKSILRSVPLQNAIAGEVAEVLKSLLGSAIGGEGVRAGGTSVVAVDASNTVILRGSPSEIARLIPIIEDLDKSGTSKIDLSVVRLKNASAEEIVPVLQEMIDKTFSAEGSGNSPSIVFHQPTNSLIINADAESQRIIQSVVRQLDIRRPQVLIEAIVVNLSDNIARDLGVQYILSGNGNSAIPFTSNTSASTRPNLLTAAGAAFLLDNQQQDSRLDQNGNSTTSNTVLPGTSSIIDAAIGSLLGISGFTLGGGGTTKDGTFFAAILTAVQADTDSNVLSTPFAVTLDNQTARLQVGQEIPVTTGESLGQDLGNTFRTVERQEVGVILEVTPQINEGDTIMLDITQEVSSINGALTASNSDFVINKAKVTTKALADNGEILILGGLIDDNRQLSETKVPFLGDVPVLGRLFKSSSRNNTRSTLMVFIKSTILRDKETAVRATSRKYEYIRRQQILKDAKGQASIDLLVEEYMGTDPADIPAPAYSEPDDPK